MKKYLPTLLLVLINLTTINCSYSQSNLIDCNNVSYNMDTFYVSLNYDIISNTIYYNDPISMIYPSQCLILDDTTIIDVDYPASNSDCIIYTHLTQDSSRDTIDFEFEVTFKSTNFPHNTVVSGNLVIEDIESSCSTPVTIILQNGTLDTPDITNYQKKKLIKTVDFLGREINTDTNIPIIEIYDDGSIVKKMVIK